MSESDIDPEDTELIEGEDEDEARANEEWQPARSDEREQRQHATQQHGDSFAVETNDDD